MSKRKGVLRKFLSILIIASLFLTIGCDIDPEAKAREQKKLVKELAREKTDSLYPVLDSLCDLRKEMEIVRLRDSIIEVRLADIRSKMEELEQ